MTTELPAAVAEHIAAVNAFDTDRVLATFAPGAVINDNRREISGAGAIRAFVAKEIVGASVTMEIREVIEHDGDVIVRARYDGSYDKAGLPEDLVLTNYFTVRDGKITTLIIISTQPSPY